MRLAIAITALSLFAGEAIAKEEAYGTFSVTMEPQEETPSEGVTLGRMLMKKTFKGGLSGNASGQMLTAVSQVPTSAVYVAAERFEGELNGRNCSFAMTHRGVMANGEQDLIIAIVPDSGTGQLAGISGTMTIDIRAGQHFYTLSYKMSQ